MSHVIKPNSRSSRAPAFEPDSRFDVALESLLDSQQLARLVNFTFVRRPPRVTVCHIDATPAISCAHSNGLLTKRNGLIGDSWRQHTLAESIRNWMPSLHAKGFPSEVIRQTSRDITRAIEHRNRNDSYEKRNVDQRVANRGMSDCDFRGWSA